MQAESDFNQNAVVHSVEIYKTAPTLFEGGHSFIISLVMAHIYDFNELRGSAEKIASHCVQNVLEGQEYDGLRVSGWTDDITNIAIEELSRLSPNFSTLYRALS